MVGGGYHHISAVLLLVGMAKYGAKARKPYQLDDGSTDVVACRCYF
jgi:hypothetical protein